MELWNKGECLCSKKYLASDCFSLCFVLWRPVEQLSSFEATTREYVIGDFGYWNAGPDLAIFYDDIYEQTIVEVIPLGHAETGAETMANETGTVRLELVS